MTDRFASSRQLALVFLLGALLVGGVLGFAADRLIAGDRLCMKWRDQRAMRADFHRELGLTAAQIVVVDSLLERKHQQISAIMKPVRPQLQAVSDSTRDQIARLLTPGQQARFEGWRKKLRDRRPRSDSGR